MLAFPMWRLQQGLTQEHAARLLGVGESTFALLESGRLASNATHSWKPLPRHFGTGTESLFESVRDRVESAS